MRRRASWGELTHYCCGKPYAPGRAYPSMTDMRYEAPGTVAAAVKLLAGAKGTAKVLAGGTDLIVQMRSDIVVPSLIVDIKKIAETRTIKSEKGGWRIR